MRWALESRRARAAGLFAGVLLALALVLPGALLLSAAAPAHRSPSLARAASERLSKNSIPARVPATARVLELTVDRPGEPPRLSQTFTQAGKVAALARDIDDMAPSAHGVKACWPAGPNEHEPEATFAFRASAGGPVLARAVMPAWTVIESGQCGDQLILSAPGRQTVALGDGRIVKRAQGLLGVRIHTYRYRL